jgi:hypothetical protein
VENCRLIVYGIAPPLRLALCVAQSVFKKDRTFAIKILLLILQHFKHRPLQSSPLYWRYTLPNVSSWKALYVMARSSLIAFF